MKRPSEYMTMTDGVTQHDYKQALNKYIDYLEAQAKQLILSGVSKSVVCGNCDGWGYTVDENGRRKEHCNECE